MIKLLPGDCRDVLATLPADSVQCVVTSPPYYGLRDYGCAGQIGLEATPDEYLATMVGVFREVRRVLRRDGAVWCNLGDSYASGEIGRHDGGRTYQDTYERKSFGARSQRKPSGLKPKDLLMMPARLALALQADGWWIRSDIIWHKPNPMPESCRDRPTSAHEHVYLLTKAARYYYDADAVREDGVPESASRYNYAFTGDAPNSGKLSLQAPRGFRETNGTRNLRNVWTIATAPYSEAHFATFPPALAERCIKAGSRPGDTILDPFAGAGTTLLVADRLQRDAIGIELNTGYTEMAMQRCRDDAPLLHEMGPEPEHPVETEIADLFAEAAE